MVVTEIRLQGDVADDFGRHDITLVPDDSGQPIRRRNRYVGVWRRDKEGGWKLRIDMDYWDIADPFRPELTP